MRWIDGRAVQIQVGIDITEEHFAKERLIEAKNEAEKAKDTNETLLLKQSQMASMGEMIGAIAHQWRQPLNSFSLLIQDLEMAYDFNELDKTYLTDTVTRCKTLVKFMSQTIDDFRAFFQQNRDIVEFSLLHSIKQVISFLDAQFRVNNINIELIGTDALIYGLPNEFKQVILNILVNAKDAFKEREIQNASVKIELIVTPNSATITFIDNAGGIEQNIIDKVFNPYFTTKESKGGTGIGLYVGKTIIEEHMNGNLKVYNNDNGATFIISLPL
jgi:signal transduction histidine kinase